MVAVCLLPNLGWAIEEKMGLKLEWTFNTSDQFPGLSFGAGHQGPPTVWDIDDDGVNEILWGTRRGDSRRLWCIREDGTFEWTYPPIEEDGLPGNPTSKVSLVDVNNDDVYEICLAGHGRLHVVNPDGSEKWTWDEPQEAGMFGAPQALDVDGDGYVEFFMQSRGSVYRISHEGEMVWTTPQLKGGASHPTVVDVDGDGSYEVLWASDDHHTYCASADTGEIEWKTDLGSNQPKNCVIVADINYDREYEIVTWSDAPTSAVLVLNSRGTELARWTYPKKGINIRMCHAMGDVDEDGSMDLAVMGGDAGFVIDIGASTPTTKWRVNFTDWSATGKIPEGAQANHYSSYQLIADIDGDDQQEILWLAPYPIVTDGATGELEGYFVNQHISRNRRQENGGWWGDVDNDGFSEWIVELNGNSHPQTQLYCLTMNGKFPARAYWPEYYHSSYPAGHQETEDWLLSKGGYSNSLWFTIPEICIIGLPIITFGIGICKQPIKRDDWD
jgi:outer membrane protein assembly factor BamB